MKHKRNYTWVIISLISLTISCTKSGGSGGSGGNPPPPADPCAGSSFKFAAEVQPIINSTCANSISCHAGGSVNPGGPLTDYNLIFSKRTSIKFQIENGLMPKGGSLTTAQKNTIICWINSGAPNN